MNEKVLNLLIVLRHHTFNFLLRHLHSHRLVNDVGLGCCGLLPMLLLLVYVLRGSCGCRRCVGSLNLKAVDVVHLVLVALWADAPTKLVGTEPVLLSANHSFQIDRVV